MDKSMKESKAALPIIKRLASIGTFLAVGSIFGTSMYLNKLDAFVHNLADSRVAVSHGFITLFGFSFTTPNGDCFRYFNWGAVLLFPLLLVLILVEYYLQSKCDNAPNTNEGA